MSIHSPDVTDSAEAEGVVGERQASNEYERLLVRSEHPQQLEAAISIVCELYRTRNYAYVEYLRGSTARRPRRPGYESQSPRWREADASFFGALSALAAVVGVLYPSPNKNNQPPLNETRALITERVGALCSGWPGPQGSTEHHPDAPCPLHGISPKENRER